jgi:hypothetical protein
MKRTKINKYRIKRLKKHRRTKKLVGGEKSEEQKLKDSFRNMFMNALIKLQEAVRTRDNSKIQKSINGFNNGFSSNQLNINTLIPVTTNNVPINKDTYTTSQTPIVAFVSPLVPIFSNIDDLRIKKSLIASFIKNKGNINLKSYTKNITALSEAIRLQDKELVKYLLEYGADVNGLTEEQNSLLNNMIYEQEVEQIKEEPVKTVKLVIPSVLPSEEGYDPTVEPDFWKPLFEEFELTAIKNRINAMMNMDSNIPFNKNEITELWSVCKINQAIIPTYFTQMTNEPYQLHGAYYSDQNIDFSNYNIILCASLLLFGIITKKMIGQDYTLIFKGGKAIQLELAGIQETATYKTEDIDLLVMPKKDVIYDENNVKNLAGHIAYLIKWFFNNPTNTISVQAPNPLNKRANPFIFKLSYIKTSKKYDNRINAMINDYKQFSDIDFRDIPETIKPFFENSKEYTFYISELDEYVLFRCPNIGSLLDEKIYYYAKYNQFKYILQQGKKVTEEGYQNLTISACDMFLDKFRRAILAMNNAVQKYRFPGIPPNELQIKEISSIKNRLNKLGINDNATQERIVHDLYINSK